MPDVALMPTAIFVCSCIKLGVEPKYRHHLSSHAEVLPVFIVKKDGPDCCSVLFI